MTATSAAMGCNAYFWDPLRGDAFVPMDSVCTYVQSCKQRRGHGQVGRRKGAGTEFWIAAGAAARWMAMPAQPWNRLNWAAPQPGPASPPAYVQVASPRSRAAPLQEPTTRMRHGSTVCVSQPYKRPKVIRRKSVASFERRYCGVHSTDDIVKLSEHLLLINSFKAT